MKKKKIIRAGREFVLHEYIPDFYVMYDKANKALEQLRVGMATWVSEEKFNEMNISIWVYESDRANAFCYYIDGNNYIVLSIGLILSFWNEANEFVEQEDFSQVFNLSENSKPYFIEELFFDMLVFTVAHEFGHIAHGHLKESGCSNYIDEMLETKDGDNNKFKNWLTQLKEYDADSFAATIHSFMFLQNWNDDIKVNCTNFDKMVLANYLCFRTFAEKMGRNFDEYLTKDFDEVDHPHPGIRMQYSFIVYGYWIGRYHKYTEDTIFILSSGSHAVVAYEKNVLKKSTFKECYYSVAFTEKGSQHIMNLHNGWQKLIDYYNGYAYILIEKIGYVHSMPFALNESGDFILKE